MDPKHKHEMLTSEDIEVADEIDCFLCAVSFTVLESLTTTDCFQILHLPSGTYPNTLSALQVQIQAGTRMARPGVGDSGGRRINDWVESERLKMPRCHHESLWLASSKPG